MELLTARSIAGEKTAKPLLQEAGELLAIAVSSIVTARKRL
jgi:hypothetical protein